MKVKLAIRLSNSPVITDRIKAVELFATRTKLQPKLGSCDDCKWVSDNKKNCNNPDISNCNVFTNSLFEPNIKSKNLKDSGLNILKGIE